LAAFFLSYEFKVSLDGVVDGSVEEADCRTPPWRDDGWAAKGPSLCDGMSAARAVSRHTAAGRQFTF
jgi:hypothetical protein